MKKTFSILVKSALTFVVLFIVASCGGSVPAPDAVAGKIDSGKELSTKDYTAMIEYCGKYAQEAQKYYDLINAQPNDSTAEAVKAASSLADLYGSYKYLDLFRTKLAQTDLAKLGAENEKKVKDYAKYQGFPLPIGEDANLEDPNVVGMIEQTPASDTVSETTGVISTGAGEAVDINVK